MRLKDKATVALQHFEQRHRKPDAPATWHAKQDAPQWVQDLCFAGHEDASMLPDDWRYRFIVEALIAMAEGDEHGDTLEPSRCRRQLTEWLNSHTDRFTYVDDARAEWGGSEDTFLQMLGGGQLYERREVFHAVAAYLEDWDPTQEGGE